MKAAPARRSLWLAGLLSVALALFCAGLGFWQVRRLAWKTDLLARLDARLAAAPAPLPPEEEWSRLDPAADEYRRVRADGVFDHAREAFRFEGAGLAGAGPRQPGYFVLTPLRRDDGSTVIVNRGFIPQARRDPATRRDGQVPGRVAVVGLMRFAQPRGPLTPADAPERLEWMTRDPAGIAARLGLVRVAPFVVDAEPAAVPGGLPQGGAVRPDIPNNHLAYAWTWFALSATALVMFFAYARSVLRRG